MSSRLRALHDTAEARRIIAADSGAGASQQADWTALVADLVMRTADRTATSNQP